MTAKNKTFWVADRVAGVDIIALLDNGSLTALGVHDSRQPLSIGAILHGRVVGYNTAMGGFDVSCDALATPLLLKAPRNAHKGGDPLRCQIKNLPQEKGKVPVVTTDLRLIGFHAVYCPEEDSKVHYSRNIDNKRKAFLKNAIDKPETGAVILRGACQKAHIEIDAIQYEIRHLLKRWNSIETNPADLAHEGVPHTLDIFMKEHRQNTPIHATKDFMNGTFHIWLGNHMPHAAPLFKKEKNTYESYDLDSYINPIYEEICPINPSLSVAVESTKAMTALDVNYNGKKGAEEANRQAVPEVARQIRLRHITGAVLIDFLRMKNKEERDRIEKAMKELLPPTKDVTHGGFTRLGLYEMAIKQDYPPVTPLLAKILEI